MSAASLHTLVSQLRATLGDDARTPRFVRTVATFGYAFVAFSTQRRTGTPG